ANLYRNKKALMRGLSWPHRGPLPPGNALTAGRADTRGLPGHLPVPLPTTVAGSYPRWLGPWRHATQEHLAQRPDVMGQPRGHGRCPRLPLRDGARAVGRSRRRQRHTQARMRQAKMVLGVEQYQLLPQAVLPLAQRADPSPDRGHMLAHREVEALNERG